MLVALERFELELKQQGLTSRVAHRGEGAFRSTVAEIINHRGQTISTGAGKGRGRQSEASAKFEAFEHLASRIVSNAASLIELNTYADLSRRHQVFVDTLPPGFERSIYARQHTHWAKLSRLGAANGCATAYAPLFVIEPVYWQEPRPGNQVDLAALGHVASNNGIAAGTSTAEATLHSLNEQVERHALGGFYCDTFIREHGRTADLVTTSTLPAELRAIVAEIERRHRETVYLFYLRDGFGIPCFAALSGRRRCTIPPLASGCSLNREYAAERALLELLQGLDLRDAEDTGCAGSEALALESSKPWPGLQRAIQKEFADAASNGQIRVHAWEFADIPELPHHPAAMSVTDQLEVVNARMAGDGYTPYVVPLYESPTTGLACVRTYIPEIDNTHLLVGALEQAGALARPNRRAIARLSATASTPPTAPVSMGSNY